LETAAVDPALRHPNIVQVFDIGEFRRQPSFHSSSAPAATLSKALNGEPQFAARGGRDDPGLARAIQLRHEQGIVHRDLKPGNVLLSADFRLRPGEQSTIESAPALSTTRTGAGAPPVGVENH